MSHRTACTTSPRSPATRSATSTSTRRVLGLRLVKQTVNFDAPDTYHLYYGDAAGRPSTLLTFFPWRGVPAGRQGTGLTTATAFSVPPESLGWWQRHLAGLGLDAELRAPATARRC